MKLFFKPLFAASVRHFPLLVRAVTSFSGLSFSALEGGMSSELVAIRSSVKLSGCVNASEGEVFFDSLGGMLQK